MALVGTPGRRSIRSAIIVTSATPGSSSSSSSSPRTPHYTGQRSMLSSYLPDVNEPAEPIAQRSGGSCARQAAELAAIICPGDIYQPRRLQALLAEGSLRWSFHEMAESFTELKLSSPVLFYYSPDPAAAVCNHHSRDSDTWGDICCY